MGSITVRFPDGAKEFRFPEKLPVEGDVLWHEGQRFRVISIQSTDDQHAIVIVEADSTFTDTLRSEEGALVLEPTN
jgi:hypothetical protein